MRFAIVALCGVVLAGSHASAQPFEGPRRWGSRTVCLRRAPASKYFSGLGRGRGAGSAPYSCSAAWPNNASPGTANLFTWRTSFFRRTGAHFAGTCARLAKPLRNPHINSSEHTSRIFHS